MPVTQVARTNTKQELRSHAQRLFAKHGYDGVSMRDIAGSVGIRQSAIYNHFQSKQHLLVDLMVNHMHVMLDAMRVAIDFTATPKAQLESFARFHVNFQIDYSDAVFIAYMELRSLEDEGHASVVVLRDQYEQTLRGILDAGIEAGDFVVNNSSVVARGLLAMMTGVTVWYRPDGDLTRDEVTESYIATVLRAVGSK